MRTRLAAALVTLTTVLLCLVLAEVGLRITHYGETVPFLSQIVQYDPLLGWAHRRNVTVKLVTQDFQNQVRYNGQGFRGKVPSFSKPFGVRRVLVLGDSFADGYAVPLDNRFTEVLGDRLGSQYEVINLGIAGYSTDQELLMLESVGFHYDPDTVVLAFYYNDVWGNGSRYLSNTENVQKPVFVLDTHGGIRLTNSPVPRPIPTRGSRLRLFDLMRNAIRSNDRLYTWAIKLGLASGLPPGQQPPNGGIGTPEEFKAYAVDETSALQAEWSVTAALLARMQAEVSAHHARLLVFYVPSRLDASAAVWARARIPPNDAPGLVAHRLADICSRKAIEFLDPTSRFQIPGAGEKDYFPHDPHWNVSGNRLAGETLADYLGKQQR